MRLQYFPDTDTALLEFSDGEVIETREVNENICIDIDAKGQVLSMTIEHAKANAEDWEFTYQEVSRSIA